MPEDYENYTPPTAKKKPADRKPKKQAEAALADDPRTITVQGIDLTINPEVFDDFELLGDIRRLDRGDTTSVMAMPAALEALLGAEQYRTVLNHLRGKNGRVTLESGADFIGDLFKAYDPN